MTQTTRLETEPIFNIHIEFCDGSKPIEYFNLNLVQAAKVLQDWSEEWILIPEDCRLNGTTWRWHANVRQVTKPKTNDIEDYAEILDPEYIPEVMPNDSERYADGSEGTVLPGDS